MLRTIVGNRHVSSSRGQTRPYDENFLKYIDLRCAALIIAMPVPYFKIANDLQWALYFLRSHADNDPPFLEKLAGKESV